MNLQQIYDLHSRYPIDQPRNPCNQHVVVEVVLVYFQQISTHEQLDGSLHLCEHPLWTSSTIIDIIIPISSLLIKLGEQNYKP